MGSGAGKWSANSSYGRKFSRFFLPKPPRIRKTFLSAIAIAVAFLGFPEAANAASGWTDFGTIVSLEQNPGNGGSVSNQVFLIVNVSTNPSGCSVGTGFYFSFSLTGAPEADIERKKRIFAMLLTAQMASRPVRIFVTGTCHQVNYAELDGVIISS